jgi:decaprenyl-phosphate phosphoribosyltransferase
MNNNSPVRSLDIKFTGAFGLIRPKQWVKNGFVFAPLIFSGQIFHFGAFVSALLATFFFCIASSAVYIVNDIHDVEQDRRHPKKSLSRPLASGVVTQNTAFTILGILYGILILGWFMAPKVIIVIVIYLLMNVAYTFALKNQPVVDIFVIAIGFVLRIYAGAAALDLGTSAWMCITTLCLALYLAAVKRRQEFIQSGSEGRMVLTKYSVGLVERYAEMSATGALLFYSMFVMSTRPELVITIPLVLYGIFRYWYVVDSKNDGESPTDALLADWQLILVINLWVIACIWALWKG